MCSIDEPSVSLNILLFRLRSSYYEWTPIKAHLSQVSQLSTEDTEELQERLLNEFSKGDESIFPIYPQHRVKYLKRLITCLEEKECEVNEHLYEALQQAITASTDNYDDQVHYYKTYFVASLDNDLEMLRLPLCESNLMLNEGTTGLVTWQAAQILSCALRTQTKGLLKNNGGCSKTALRSRNEQIWKHVTNESGQDFENNEMFVLNKDDKVLELGAGSGFLSLSLIKMGILKASNVILSDCNTSVLTNLGHNALLHGGPIVKHLDWCDLVEVGDYDDPHVILASDVVFEPKLISPLVNVIKVFLSSNTTKAIVACTERNEETLRLFEKHLKDIKLSATAMTINTNGYVNYGWCESDNTMKEIKVKIFVISNWSNDE